MKPRKYQADAVNALLAYWAGGGGDALEVLPTGSGKSLICAMVTQALLMDYPGTRVLVASHVQELVSQDYDALAKIWSEPPAGVYSAGLGQRDGSKDVCYASVQSIFKQPEVVGPRHVLIIDEAHLLSRKQEGMYQRLITSLRKTTPGMRVLGLTATPFRMDSGLMVEPWRDQEPLFADVVYDAPIKSLLEQGYLAPLITRAPETKLSAANIGKSGGDYIASQLDKRFNDREKLKLVAAELVRALATRNAAIAFCPGIATATTYADILKEDFGMPVATLFGDTDKKERVATISGMRDGTLRILVGVGAITTGLDIPHVDVLSVLRHTLSKGLYSQMLGRGMRIAPGKTDCLVLDHAGNIFQHGPIDMLDGSKTAGEGGTVPVRECPGCHNVIMAALRTCPHCNQEFAVDLLRKLTEVSSSEAIISGQEESHWYYVSSVSYRRHTKPEKPDSLRVDYLCGAMTVSEWLLFEHGGFARSKTERLWKQRATRPVVDEYGICLAPDTVTEALVEAGNWKVPGRLRVQRDGKFLRIIETDFSIPALREVKESA